jgi:hypothetical protein
MKKKLQEKIQRTFTPTPEQKKEIDVFNDQLEKDARTEEEKLDNLYKINLTEDPDLSKLDTSEVARFIKNQPMPFENYIPSDRLKAYEEGWTNSTDPTTNMTSEKRDEYLKNYAKFDEKYFSGEMVYDPITEKSTWKFNTGTGGTRKRKPCNRRKKTRRKGSKRMKKKNKAGKLKHSHKLRKLH